MSPARSLHASIRAVPRVSARPLRAALPVTQTRHLSAPYGYEQAKSLIYTEHGEPSSVLRLHSHSIPPAHSDLLTLRLLAAPINPADINTIQGTYPTKPPFTTNLSTAEPAAVPGNEGVAEVISAGSGVKDLKKGDWVIARAPGVGTWRTHIQAPASNFVKIPDDVRGGITAIQAATVSVNPCTAYAMLKGYIGGARIDTIPRPLAHGDWFVQNGANSGVGRAAIQLGRQWGFKSLNVIRARPGGNDETNALKSELKDLGATIVVTEDEVNEKGFSRRVVDEFQAGRKQDIKLALNCVGGKSALNLAKLVGEGGYHVTYGAMAKQPTSLPAGMLIFRDVRFAGFWVSRWSDVCKEEKLSAVQEILRLTMEGKFRDARFEEIEWGWETEGVGLIEKVQGTLEGFRGGKGVFVFKDT